MVNSQEEYRNSFDRALAQDCEDPELFRALSGFNDEFPYATQSQPIPKVVGQAALPEGWKARFQWTELSGLWRQSNLKWSACLAS